MEAILKELLIGTKPEARENPFSGEVIELDPTEVAVHDFIKGCEMIGRYKDMQTALGWFAEKNPKAYMVLLD
tara:strand:+ start:232 stop:447 length:216 start_codon:yes stop_codon:yes gene_type:complete